MNKEKVKLDDQKPSTSLKLQKKKKPRCEFFDDFRLKGPHHFHAEDTVFVKKEKRYHTIALNASFRNTWYIFSFFNFVTHFVGVFIRRDFSSIPSPLKPLRDLQRSPF